MTGLTDAVPDRLELLRSGARFGQFLSVGVAMVVNYTFESLFTWQVQRDA